MEPKAPTERTDPQCIARPSPFKVNGDQSTDRGSGHEASPYMPTAPSVNGLGKAWLTDGGVVFTEYRYIDIFFNFLTDPKAPTERTDPQCIACPSPFKVNGDQSTDGGSGHEATPRAHCTVSQRTWEGVAD